MNLAHSTQAPETHRVWDPFVRIFHWSLVACVVLNQFVLEDGKTAHEWVGYTASALVLARVLWGFVGTRHARFSDFFPTPTGCAGPCPTQSGAGPTFRGSPWSARARAQ